MIAESEPGPTASQQARGKAGTELRTQGSRLWAPLCVFALALGVRGSYLAELAGSPLLSALVGDSRYFDEWARRIAGGEWWRGEVFFQAPLYPYFMAVVYQVTGADPFHVRVVQSVLGSLGCALLAVAGRQLLGRRVGFAAGGILALYPPAIFFDALIQKPSLALFLTCSLLALVAWHREFALRSAAPGPRAVAIAALLGVVLGLLAITRQNALVLIPVIGVWLLLGFPARSWAVRSGWLAALGAGAALVFVPVGLRNLAVGGEFLITTSNLGVNFYIGNNPEADGLYSPLLARRGNFQHEQVDALELAQEARGRDLGPGEVSRYWLERSLDYVGSQPGDWLALMGRKLAMVLNHQEYMDSEAMEVYQDESRLLNGAAGWFHFGVLFPLAVFGAVLCAGRLRTLWVLPLAFAVMTFAIAFFLVLARFRIPMVPLLALFLVGGLSELPRIWKERARLRLLVAVGLAALAAHVSALEIEGDPDRRLTTYRNMAASLSAMGRHEEALGLLERAAARGADPPALRVLRARALVEVGKREEAVALYREVLRQRPGHWGARAELASALAELGDIEGALKTSRVFLSAGPEPLRAFAAHSPEFFRQVAQAERSAEAALLRRAQDPGARLNLAVWHALRGRHEQALEECRTALEVAPEHPVGRWVWLDIQRWISDSGARVPAELAPGSS